MSRGREVTSAKRRRVLTFAAVAALAFSISPPSQAQTQFHRYSYALDSGEGLYTGLETARTDGVYTVPDLIVYEPLWVSMNSQRTMWAEIGTAHPSGRPRYWYFYVSDPGRYSNFVWQHEFNTTARRALRLEKTVPTTWRATVDGKNFGLPDYSFGVARYGVELLAGLESYSANAVAPAVTDSPLHYEVFDSGIWPRWRGRDFSRVEAPLCGRWTSDYGWRFGQNTTC